MTVIRAVAKKILKSWNHFFHREADLSIFGPLRIGFAILLLINVLAWWPDLEKWFGETGVLPLEISRLVVDSNSRTIFEWLPKTSFVLWSCYLLLITNLVCLLIGFLSRIQLICIFVLFTSFCHRNNMIFDGEDTLFRMLAFYLILCPVGNYLSVDNWLREKLNHNKAVPDGSKPRKLKSKLLPIWPLRLIQIQTCSVLFFSGIEKFRGELWRDGTALFYVSRLDDMFCRFPIPEFLFNSFTMIAIATWSAMMFELTLPILVWFRRTRLITLGVILIFHLSLEYMMNLNMFQWLMILGWTSFLGHEYATWGDKPSPENGVETMTV